MQQYLFRAAVLILIFSGLSCDRKAVPIITLNQGCSTNSDCAVQPGMICDLLVVPPGGKPGTCRQSCDPNATNCPNLQICNPISGACEQSCAGLPNPSNFCQGLLPSGSGAIAACVCNGGTLTAGAGGGQPICAGGAYCALTTPTFNCPNGFKPSNGSCKLACNTDAECAGLNQACDSITKTCEVSCAPDTPAGGAKCTVLNYQTLVASAVVPYTFGCSPITSTCVQSCNLPPPSTGVAPVLSINRTFCYAPGGATLGTGVGTYEIPCQGSTPCSKLTGFQCAEGACQQECKDPKADCQDERNTRNGRKTCDVISGVCRTGCKNSCSTAGMACSPITSTCVQKCVVAGTSVTSAVGCPSGGDIRSACYVQGNLAGLGGNGSCEQDSKKTCSTNKLANFPNGLQAADGICQQKCSTLSECTSNQNSGRTTCDLISSVCRVGCDPAKSGADCTVSGTSCSQITATCVDTCTGTATSSNCPQTSSRTGCPNFATNGTCEEPCLSSGTCSATGLVCVSSTNTCHLPAPCPTHLKSSSGYCKYEAS